MSKNKNPKAEDVLDALDKYFNNLLFVRFRELNVDVDVYDDDGLDKKFFNRDSYSRIDYWAMTIWNTAPPLGERAATTSSIEVKISRRDFKKELKNPQKQRWALMYSNLFYYCCPKGLIKPEELPPFAGLLEYENGNIFKTIKAPFRDAMPPRWTFVASLLKHYRLKDKSKSTYENLNDNIENKSIA